MPLDRFRTDHTGRLTRQRTRGTRRAGLIVSSAATAALVTSLSPVIAHGALDAPSATAAMATVTPIRAAAFVDSVGVGVHLDRPFGPYQNYPKVKQALLNLGVHHIRDSLKPGKSAKFVDLGTAGIKITGTIPRDSDTDAELNRALELAMQARSALSSIGGPNEYETTVSDWPTKLQSFQRRLYTKVQANPALAPIPVLGPSLRTATNEKLLGDISGILDAGAVHAYPYGAMPEKNASGYIAEARVNSGREPIVVSETGMSNANDTLRQRYDLPFSLRAAGIYTPRLVLEYFRLGVARTYLYQLMNEDGPGTPADLAVRGRYFGLLYSDFTPKPSFLALRNLLTALADRSVKFSPTPLQYSITGTTGLRQLVFQKSDGSYYFVVWNPISVWETGSGKDLFPGPVPATLSLSAPAAKIQVIDVQRGPLPVRTVSNVRSIRFDAQPWVQLIKVIP